MREKFRLVLEKTCFFHDVCPTESKGECFIFVRNFFSFRQTLQQLIIYIVQLENIDTLLHDVFRRENCAKKGSFQRRTEQ